MTRDQIIALAREAGLERILAVHEDGTRTVETMRPDLLERFAALVAAAEREQCAKFERELAEANARLDWLDTVECGIQHKSYGEYWHYIGKGFPKAREVIDAAMKEGK